MVGGGDADRRAVKEEELLGALVHNDGKMQGRHGKKEDEDVSTFEDRRDRTVSRDAMFLLSDDTC